MKIEAVFIVIILLALPLFASGAKVDRFQGGNAEAVADLIAPGNEAVVQFNVPAECHILNATVSVSAMAPDGNISGWPKAVQVLLNDSVLWEFNGTDYGALGNQDGFANHTSEWMSKFNQSGGTNGTAIRLPKNATVQSAVMDVNWTGPEEIFPFINFTGAAPGDRFGYSVSNAGDVNGDGYDDVLVGAPLNNSGGHFSGEVYIYFGGPSMDAIADVILIGERGDSLGNSVSGAGDVNGDGYDDVIVGAWWNGTGSYSNGKALIYLGGQDMDSVADVTFTGEGDGDRFGVAVSGAGDVNDDGFNDVIVGAYCNGAGGYAAGRAYIYFGGQGMDNASDVTFTGGAPDDRLGCDVSDAGDVNNDGYDDVIVGVNGMGSGGSDAGGAYIFFGGAHMDNVADVFFTGESSGDLFGVVSGAGDVNNDGFDDIVVGASYNGAGGHYAGRAYLYFGGKYMDNTADVVFTGEAAEDCFGHVSDAGDMNNDGYDDVIIGAIWNNAGGEEAGRAYIYLGGANMDSTADAVVSGTDPGGMFGYSVSCAGDVDNDGHNDVVIGAFSKNMDGNETGMAYLYHCVSFPGILDSSISVAKESVMNCTGYFNGTNTTQDFSRGLNDFLDSNVPAGADTFGNAYVDVPVSVIAQGPGNVTLSKLNITYNYTSMVPDFSDELNAYIAAHRSEKDAGGNISVPIKIRAHSSGRMRLLDLNIITDEAPILLRPVPNLEMDEDSVNNNLLDLYQYFQDDYDPNDSLEFSIESAANSSIVNVGIFSNRHLSADALTGDANDNWTGVVSLRIRCTDSRGFSVVSNSFDLVIRNVNDPPIVTSMPPTNATVGARYVYQLTAVDGDNDPLTFSLLQKPENMTVSAGGEISWNPSQSGMYNVTAAVSDGLAVARQDFRITVEPNGAVVQNRIPRFTSIPVTNATVGIPYTYNASATDDDNDTLSFSLANKSEGMGIDPATGKISWTPMASQIGNQTIIVNVSDGKGGETEQPFVILVINKPRPSVTSGDDLWCVLPSVILLMVTVVGFFLWRTGRSRTPKQ